MMNIHNRLRLARLHCENIRLLLKRNAKAMPQPFLGEKMPFPEVERVIYGRNPLEEVVCQLRFPPVLKIDSELPAEFQERIRKKFVDFSETINLQLEVPASLQSQIPVELVERLVPQLDAKNYQFSSSDKNWQINLTRYFLALTARNYQRREQFIEQLEAPLAALISIYQPAYFSRIGLRYIDVIKPSMLGLDRVSWRELLKPHILGVLGEPNVGNDVSDFESTFVIPLEDKNSNVKILLGFETGENNEHYFKIDSDFYVEGNIAIDAAKDKLEFFGTLGSRLFRWCITERLHKALAPGQVIYE